MFTLATVGTPDVYIFYKINNAIDNMRVMQHVDRECRLVIKYYQSDDVNEMQRSIRIIDRFRCGCIHIENGCTIKDRCGIYGKNQNS